jgi:hypothetical protein
VLAFQFGRDGSAQLAPALFELGQTVALQVLGDVIEVDARRRQLGQDVPAGVIAPG